MASGFHADELTAIRRPLLTVSNSEAMTESLNKKKNRRRMEKLLEFARPASAIDPSQAAARCGTKEHLEFVERLVYAPAPAA